jgi:hypothetical protein
MLRRNKTETIEVPKTNRELAAGHLKIAERNVKIGGVGTQQMQRMAVQATAHATMAMCYLMMDENTVLPDVEVPEDDLADEET